MRHRGHGLLVDDQPKDVGAGVVLPADQTADRAEFRLHSRRPARSRRWPDRRSPRGPRHPRVRWQGPARPPHWPSRPARSAAPRGCGRPPRCRSRARGGRRARRPRENGHGVAPCDTGFMSSIEPRKAPSRGAGALDGRGEVRSVTHLGVRAKEGRKIAGGEEERINPNISPQSSQRPQREPGSVDRASDHGWKSDGSPRPDDSGALWKQRVVLCALCAPTAVGTGGSTATFGIKACGIRTRCRCPTPR